VCAALKMFGKTLQDWLAQKHGFRRLTSRSVERRPTVDHDRVVLV